MNSISRVEPSWESLLLEVFQAYRQGLLRRPLPDCLFPARSFDALKFLGTIGWIPLKERSHLRHLHTAYGRGLVAARQSRLDEAQHHYKKAKESLDCLEGPPRLSWFLGSSTYEPGVAYLDFKLGLVEVARERLGYAMDADLELERAGLPVMCMHRIQQGHNLVRMDLLFERREVAIDLAGNLLAYLENQTEELPFHREWRTSSSAVPRSLVQTMIHQIIGETVSSIITGAKPEEEWKNLIESARLCQEPESAVFPPAQYVLLAEKFRLISDAAGYLRNLERFFRFGIRHCHMLWYPILIELAEFCRKAGTRYSLQVGDWIVRDSMKWKCLSHCLKDYLADSAALHVSS